MELTDKEKKIKIDSDYLEIINNFINYRTMIFAPICHGELADKLTILKIKMEKMTDLKKLENVTKEYNLLLPFLHKIGLSEDHELFQRLYAINLEFWEYHDWQREKWRNLVDENLVDIELFKKNRDEHILNDNRARVKKEINTLTKSEIVEEKQFISYNI